MRLIEIDRLLPHRQNPRIDKAREKEAIDQLAAVIRAEGFREDALIVRPHPNGDYQIVSGHRRWHAADLAGLTAVPCEVREMDDATAYMLLQTQNTDSALSPIEAGLHQLSSGMPQRDYAERAHVNRNSLKVKVDAARVYEKIKARSRSPLSATGGVSLRPCARHRNGCGRCGRRDCSRAAPSKSGPSTIPRGSSRK